MRILSRYVLKAHVAPFFFALSALTLIMLLDQVGDRFKMLMGKGLEPEVILEVVFLSLPFILAMTVPMAVLIAVLYAFNRLAAENEITAMKASGVNLPRLLAPVLVASVFVAGGLVWFNNDVLPESNHRLQVLLASISQKKPTLVLRERTINEVLEGELFLRAGRIDRGTSDLEDVVIYDRRDRERDRIIYADSGRMALDESQTDLFLDLYDGVSQERKTADPASYQRIHFGKMVMRVPEVTNELNREALEDGYRGDREMPIAEMRKRVRDARERAIVAEYESRTFTVMTTRRLLGLEAEPAVGGEPGETARGGDDGDGSTARLLMAEGREPDPRPQEPDPRPQEPPGADGSRTRAPREVPNADGRGAQDAVQGRRSLDSAARAESIRAAQLDSAFAEAEARSMRAVRSLTSLTAAYTRQDGFHSRKRASQRRANQYAVEIQKKYSIPFACIVFVLIGAPVAMRLREAGVAGVVAASLFFFCAYYVSLVAGEDLADQLVLSPFWAMWTPNVLFGAMGLGFLWRAVRVG